MRRSLRKVQSLLTARRLPTLERLSTNKARSELDSFELSSSIITGMKASRRSRARDARKSASDATDRAQERGTEPAGAIAPEATEAATVGPLEPYHTGWEHLFDELRRLDLLICCRLPEQGPGAAPAMPLQEFKGLVLTEEEIRRLLGDPLDTSSTEMSQHADDLPTRRRPRPARSGPWRGRQRGCVVRSACVSA